MKILSNKISKYLDKEISMSGWVYSVRRSGKIGFLTFRDGFGLVQCIVAKNDVGEENFDIFKSLTQESSVSVNGEVVKNERAPGGFEIITTDLSLHQLSSEYPISPKEHGADFLMNHRHLWLPNIQSFHLKHHLIFFDESLYWFDLHITI